MTSILAVKPYRNYVAKILSVLALCSATGSALAAPVDKNNIAFIGPLGEQMQLKPYQTQHHDAIINNLLPRLQADTKTVSVFGKQHKWQTLSNINALTLAGVQGLKFTVKSERFSQGTLKLNGIEQAQVFINGQKQNGKKHSYELAFATGEHQVVIIAEQVANWHDLEIEFNPESELDNITISQQPKRTLSAKQLFDAPTISMLSLAPDAKHYISSKRHYSDKTGNQAQIVTELKNQDDEVVYRFESGQPSNVIWSPDNNSVIYLLDGQLKQLDRETLSLNVIASDLEGASGFAFYDNHSLIYAWSKSPTPDNGLTKHYRGLQDRWSYARTTTQAYLLDINSGLSKALSEGPLSHQIEDFNSEQSTVLLSRSAQAMEASTHPVTTLVEADIESAKQTVIGQFKTFNQAKYTTKGVYIIAGPDFKDGLGRNIPRDMLANNYDGQLYLLNSDGTQAKALSKNFDPAISQLNVLKNGDAILKVTEQDTQQLYLFDLSKSRFNKLNTKLDVVEQFSVAKNRSPAILYSGTTASAPQQLKRLNINKNRATTIWDSKPLAYTDTNIPKLEEFNFTNQQGVEIKGRVYLPTNLDKSKKYPALIYYYGGTSPVSRGFTGRYPFNLWAENGYIVYVVQPTGATGFGQEFSAKHVNAWGEHTADDIIQGTQALLAHYSFIDNNRLGNLGASYGGFMTMLLATKTDMFSASIAHAGISNITSYWGQGWWGYLYSGEASKNSFPWNNSDLYSQRSPVFHADKVTTPLLLLHGDSDTNVPVGESHNMYTALKLLGKDVDLIEYRGADHQIFARDKRFNWWDTMLAYFDKHLKDEPQWWQYLYPAK
ncbi:prolyl oligopeptidase family serine peptidase [Pseudoalteromonas shioyasakiensis]|uniref:alpha/beta hydrolase family protein n=1 Tax=Pseudoalteromonas shioyasakiensis TaxID=1190813 RepID=UPI00211838BD|nr:prolyl oligopeptidase family serine peptidase [Pseudoalteromonas shioyasakiensis]MCQ8879852.1 prolyl oligopeptidase family serine peptidase [Pseudoalteromonas shioyasakiensis]